MSVTKSHWVADGLSSTRIKLRLFSEPFIFLYCLTHGIYFTILPQLLLSKSCHNRFNQSLCYSSEDNLSRAQNAEIFSEAAVWNMILTTSNVAISLACILPFGTLSDIVSKKKLMLIPPSLRGVQCLMFILDIQLKMSNIELLITTVCLTSLYGDILGALSLGSAYMADAVPDGPHRTVRMIGLGACSYAGSGVGAFLSGILANKYGFKYSFILGFSICAVNIVLVLIVLPTEVQSECVGDEHPLGNVEPNESKVEYVLNATRQTFVSICHFAKKYCFKVNGIQMWLLTISYFFGILCLDGESAIVTLFVKHGPLSFSPLVVGEYILLLMAVRGVGGFLLFLVISATKMADAYVVFLGFFSFIGTYVAMALSTTQTMLFSFSIFSIGYPLTLSGLRSCLTKRVSVSEHGTVLSFASFISLLGSIPMTFSINSLFKYTADIFPGICILFLAGFAILGMILALASFGMEKCSDRVAGQYEPLDNIRHSKECTVPSVPAEKEALPLLLSNCKKVYV